MENLEKNTTMWTFLRMLKKSDRVMYKQFKCPTFVFSIDFTLIYL